MNDKQDHQYSLLIVDDESDIRETYKDFFVKRGFLVDTAGDGQEGLEKLRVGEYDVVIVDIRMPKLDGIQMLQQAQAEQIETDTIILTGHGGRDEAVASLNLGVAAWFDKQGIEMPKLLEKVKRLCEGMPIEEVRRILTTLSE